MRQQAPTPTAEGRWQALVEQIPAVVYLDDIDENATTVYISPQVERLLGYPIEAWKANPSLWYETLHPEDRDETFDEYMWQRDRHDRWSLEYRMVASDGRTVWIHEDDQVIRDDEGRRLVVQGVLHDITAMKEDEERLLLLGRTKDALLHAVSHDLRGPLAAVLGAASLMTNPAFDLTDEDRTKLLRGLVTSARRMDRIASNLLDIERLERGLIHADTELADLALVVAAVLEELEAPEGRSLGADLSPVVVPLDVVLVERMTENLILNAFKHTPKRARVRVRVRPVEGGAELMVEDEGPGIPPDLREAIFEPYRRAASPHVAGAGIGLSLVERFADLHGGRAWAGPREDGRAGASFHVFLPESVDA